MYRRFFKDVKEYAYLSRHMTKAGLKAETARSRLSAVRWVLEPLAGTLILYAVFGRVLGHDQPYYMAFIFTGMLLWSFFVRCALCAVQAIRLDRDIVTRAYVPKHILLQSDMRANTCKMLISACILVIIMILQHVAVTPRILYVIPLLVLAEMMTFGFGLILMHFGVFVDDLTRAVRIGMQVLFFLSGVFYDLRKLLPEPWGTVLTRIDPAAAVIHNMRACLLYGSAPEAVTMLVWAGIAAVLCAVGLKLTYTHENTYVRNI